MRCAITEVYVRCQQSTELFRVEQLDQNNASESPLSLQGRGMNWSRGLRLSRGVCRYHSKGSWAEPMK